MNKKSIKKRPVIVGVGQYIHRPEESFEIKKPLDLIGTAVDRAAEDSGVPALVRKLDSLCLINMLSGDYHDPLGELGRRIGIHPRSQAYTWVGATAPQWFVNRTVENIVAGRVRLALICGGEAFYSKRQENKAKGAAGWDWNFPQKQPWMVGDMRDPLTALEMKYGLFLPMHMYPFFENALRSSQGQSLEQHRQELGDFLARFSEIAAGNPYAWFPERKTSREITEVTEINRMVSFPYTKYMCSIMEVDQAAALFMTDEETAVELGVPRNKWVYVLGSGDASDIWHVSQRSNFYSSPSVKAAADKALEEAGVSLEEIDHFDLYSCFPCAPRITRNMLGLPKTDPRPLTQTGGMPYFGGPGNSYALHAICRMVEILRQDATKLGLVQALSWFISKHSVGVYSGDPRDSRPGSIPSQGHQAGLDRLEGPPLVEEASGTAEVETYMLLHDRESRPTSGVIIGRLEDGRRFLAKPEKDREVLQAMTEEEFVGKRGKVRHEQDFNIFSFNH